MVQDPDTEWVRSKVSRFISETFLNGDLIGDSESLSGSGWMTSLNVLVLAEFVTREFDVEVTLEDLYGSHFSSSSAIAEFVSQRNGGRNE